MGMMPEDQLRRACERELFYGEPGRRYWGYSKDTRSLYTKDHRERDFHRILEEEYRKAIASHTEGAPAIRKSRSPDTVPGSDKTRAAKMAGNSTYGGSCRCTGGSHSKPKNLETRRIFRAVN